MRHSLLLLLALIATTALAQPAAAAATNPWIGDWTLDAAASKLHGPAPKHETVHITAARHDAFAFSIDLIEPDDSAMTMTYSNNGDGKEAPELLNGQKIDTAAFKMVDEKTVTAEGEAEDGSKWTMKATLSSDDKMFTARWHRTPAKGDAYDETEVYKK